MRTYQYDYDVEAEITELKNEIQKEEARTAVCQNEISRLRGIVRRFCDAQNSFEKMNYEKLFGTWADFDDDESPAQVKELIEVNGLDINDAMSFMAYCAGFQRAVDLFKEA